MGEQAKTDYVVLARKYRPQTFAQLVGQDALVRTLTNAIQTNKIHHAYVLTGIRGVGKTTTARIIAKALNCAGGPATEWPEDDAAALSIAQGRHIDVFEFDAASNRGVEDVQKLFEGINYAPVSGRYKVYIIDEVHMLSTTAFNALLKTLEEPPPHIKFIFATTEVHKIPVTVLSRCQRFDLKRIPSTLLAPYFTEILSKEGLSAEPAAIQLIARAADGSVRDGLSLLDQAIALSSLSERSARLAEALAKEEVSESTPRRSSEQSESVGGPSTPLITLATVESMLGTANLTQIYTLLESTLKGQTESTLAQLDDFYANGQDALGIVQGLMDTAHLLTRLKLVSGLTTSPTLTELERTRAVPLANTISMANLSRLYQMLLHTLPEVKSAEQPYQALQMAMVRITYLAPLPAIDKLLQNATTTITASTTAPQAQSTGAMAVTTPTAPERNLPVVSAGLVGQEKILHHQQAVATLPTTWPAVVKLVRTEKPALAAALENQVRCHNLQGTTLTLAIEKGLLPAPELLQQLRQVLKVATTLPWDIQTLSSTSPNTTQTSPEKIQTITEQLQKEHEERKQNTATDPHIADILKMFPGAEIESVNSPAS